MSLASKLASAVAVTLLSSGCYHAVVETGRPASATVITQPWAHSFIAGLIPPKVVQTASQCPGGVSRVETQHSILNLIAQAVTFSLYSPMTITVTCAGGGGGDAAAAGAAAVHVGPNASAEARTAAFTKAIEMAKASGEPVFVQF
jgi:hypothetical protein